MRSIRIIAAAALATTALVAVGVGTEAAQATGSRELEVRHTSVMTYEKFSALGTLSTPVVRTVKLQYRYHSGDAWTTRNTVKSLSSGEFGFFAITTSKSRYWRYYAPATASRAAITGYSKRISVVSQKVTEFFVTPNPKCLGLSDDLIAVARFYPARPGRFVTFTTNVGPMSGYEDGNGRAARAFNPGPGLVTFASVATADSYNGAAAKSSTSYTYKIVDCK